MRLLGKGPDTPCPVDRGPLRTWCEGQMPKPHPNRALGQPTSPAGDSDAGRLKTQLWVSEQREGASWTPTPPARAILNNIAESGRISAQVRHKAL